MNTKNNNLGSAQLRAFRTEQTYGGYRPELFTHFWETDRNENYLTWIVFSDFPSDGGFVDESIGRGEWPIPVNGLSWEATLSSMAIEDSERRFAKSFETVAQLNDHELERAGQYPHFVEVENPRKLLLHRILFGTEQMLELVSGFRSHVVDEDLSSWIEKLLTARIRKTLTVQAGLSQ